MKDDLPTLARKALREARGDRDEAVRLLVKWIRDDVAVAQELIDRLLKEEAWRLIKSVAESDRRAGTPRDTASAPVVPIAARKDTVRGLQLKAERALMDLVLKVTGKRLGDATRVDLIREVDALNADINSHLDLVRWYRSILNQIDDNIKRVSDIMTDEQLKSLRERAQRAREAERLK